MLFCEFSDFTSDVKINILYVSGPAAWIGVVVLLGVILPITMKRKRNSLMQKRST
jgi:hypothetical protein